MKARLLRRVGAIDEGKDVDLVGKARGPTDASLAQGQPEVQSPVYVVKDEAGHEEQVDATELEPESPPGTQGGGTWPGRRDP